MSTSPRPADVQCADLRLRGAARAKARSSISRLRWLAFALLVGACQTAPSEPAQTAARCDVGDQSAELNRMIEQAARGGRLDAGLAARADAIANIAVQAGDGAASARDGAHQVACRATSACRRVRICAAISAAFEPLTRTTPMPPLPDGVAIATMVSSEENMRRPRRRTRSPIPGSLSG